MKDLDICEKCNGLGYIKGDVCEACDGMGVPDDDIYFDKMNSKKDMSYSEHKRKEKIEKSKIDKKSDKEVGL